MRARLTSPLAPWPFCILVRYKQVRLTVPIHVCYGHRKRELPARTESKRGLEGTVAITQQHADNAIGATAIGRALVGNHQVRLAIAVYIRNAERIGIISARWIP